MTFTKAYPLIFASALLTLGSGATLSQDDAALAEMAKKAQDPLGNVKAIMTDNTIAFGGGNDDDTTYGFQIQPVYAIDNDTNYNMIARGVIPVVGLEPSVVIPPLGPDPAPENGSTWGLSDTMLQFFFSPKTDGTIKFGFGPQGSLKTRTNDRLAGPSWGAGLAGVVFGGSGNFSFGAIAMQHWGEEDNFSLLTVQPIVMYNFPNSPGAYVGYNNSITYNWNADSGPEWNVPLGLTLGRTLLLGSGAGLDLSVGAYDLVEKPDGGSDWQFKFGVSYFFN